MFKKFLFAGILLISVSSLQAGNTSTLNPEPSLSKPGVDETLVNKIAADNDFKKYYISNVEFANTIIETGAGSLFLKYIQKKITPGESADLFAKMNVSGKKEFDAIFINLKNEAVGFFNKFPKLKWMAEKEQKELLLHAFRKASTDNSITTKFIKTKNVRPEDCWWWWMVCNTACFIGCTYSNTNECYWECAGFCALEYAACWVIAE